MVAGVQAGAAQAGAAQVPVLPVYGVAPGVPPPPGVVAAHKTKAETGAMPPWFQWWAALELDAAEDPQGAWDSLSEDAWQELHRNSRRYKRGKTKPKSVPAETWSGASFVQKVALWKGAKAKDAGVVENLGAPLAGATGESKKKFRAFATVPPADKQDAILTGLRPTELSHAMDAQLEQLAKHVEWFNKLAAKGTGHGAPSSIALALVDGRKETAAVHLHAASVGNIVDPGQQSVHVLGAMGSVYQAFGRGFLAMAWQTGVGSGGTILDSLQDDDDDDGMQVSTLFTYEGSAPF